MPANVFGRVCIVVVAVAVGPHKGVANVRLGTGLTDSTGETVRDLSRSLCILVFV